MSMRIMAGESRLACFAAYIRALHGALRLEAIAYLHRHHELLCATAGVRLGTTSCGIWDCMRMRGVAGRVRGLRWGVPRRASTSSLNASELSTWPYAARPLARTLALALSFRPPATAAADMAM